MIALDYSEARQLDNEYLGTEHLPLGLRREEEGIAYEVLTQQGAALECARQEVQAMQGR